MKAFVSWSGGKDCMLALYRFLNIPENDVCCLVNMCDEASGQSSSHGLPASLLQHQANCLNIPLKQTKTTRSDYERRFKDVLKQLREEGVTAGVFGDIYLMEHRTWIERVCNESEMEPLFPLWGDSTTSLFQEFIDNGFQALTVSVCSDMLPISFLDRNLDTDFLTDILALEHADPCAENGEYHSFVYDGPLFDIPVSFVKEGVCLQDRHYYLKIREE